MLGIFRTKKADYNRLILRSLITGPKTTNQVSEFVYLNRKSATPIKQINKNELKTIVSIISRKNSRLDELENKGYIFKEDNQYELMLKGLGVALTLVGSVRELYPYADVGSALKDVKKAMYDDPLIKMIFQTRLTPEKVDKVFNFGKSVEYLQFLKDLTSDLITKGVDLDSVDNDGFFSIVMGKLLPFLASLIGFKGVEP